MDAKTWQEENLNASNSNWPDLPESSSFCPIQYTLCAGPGRRHNQEANNSHAIAWNPAAYNTGCSPCIGTGYRTVAITFRH
jgi:hypothetical protein